MKNQTRGAVGIGAVLAVLILVLIIGSACSPLRRSRLESDELYFHVDEVVFHDVRTPEAR